MGRKLDLVGQRFGRLKAIEDASVRGESRYKCACDCGIIVVKLGSKLNKGKVNSCGCIRLEKITKHGQYKSKLYSTWKHMKDRCFNKNSDAYKYYGERNVSVCNEWMNFVVFKTWCMSNGYDKNLDLDRIDNDGNYEPLNCRFITHRENSLNRRCIQSNNTSGYNGVSFAKNINKYLAYLVRFKKTIKAGYFNTAKEACIARDQYIIDNNLEHEYKLQILKGNNYDN